MYRPVYRFVHIKIFFAANWKGRKEGNILFNDALNIFMRRPIHIAIEETRCHHNMGYSFRLAHTRDRIVHTIAFVTPVVEHWLEKEIAQ